MRHGGPALVTGANSGFGLATTLRLAQRGWDVWGTVRSAAKADGLREAAAQAGVERRVRPLVLDVSDHAEVPKAFADLPDFYAVVNNAGYSELGAVEEVTAAQAKAQLDVNLVAPAVVSGCALPGMRRIGGGRIVMVSSFAGRAALLPLNAWYHASKFGLEALSDVLRIEVAAFGVHVSIVEPGFFKTGITETAHETAEERSHDAASPYAAAYARTVRLLETIRALSPPPDRVAETILEAIESRHPERRYLVGVDAHAGVALSALVPRGILDAAARFVSDLGQSAVRGAVVQERISEGMKEKD